MKKVSVIIPVYNQEELLLRALDSIPRRSDIEVIVIDDGSSDNTWINLIDYHTHNRKLDLLCLANAVNRGVAYTVNKGYDEASGEYVVLLGSDDYFYTDAFNEIVDSLSDKTDLVYFDLEDNNGKIWHLSEDTKRVICGSVKFMKRSFIGNIRCPETERVGEDWFFYEELLKKNPTERFTNKVVKHYNFPRKGSLTDLRSKGLL